MAGLPVAGRSKTARRAEHPRLATLLGESLARGQPYPEVCLSAASGRFERQGVRRSGSSFAWNRFFGCRYGCCQRTALVPRNRRSKWAGADRKSTRLNSSQVRISYAVFCLKKKKKKTDESLV